MCGDGERKFNMTTTPRETRILELDCSNRDGQLFKLKTGACLYGRVACSVHFKMVDEYGK